LRLCFGAVGGEAAEVEAIVRRRKLRNWASS